MILSKCLIQSLLLVITFDELNELNTTRLKNEMHDVSVSTIILRTDDRKLNEKGMEVNLHLKELSKEKNLFLIYNSRKIKSQHRDKGKLHLPKYGSRLLSNIITLEMKYHNI